MLKRGRRADGATRVSAPFDVVGPSGKRILRVGTTPSKDAPVGIWQPPGAPGGVVHVNTTDGRQIIDMGANEAGEGQLALSDAKGHARALLVGHGTIVVTDPKMSYQAGMMVKDGVPAVAFWNGGKRIAEMTHTAPTAYMPRR